MNRVVTILLLCIFSFSVLSVENTFRAGDTYQIKTPDNWIEIPKDILDQFQEGVYKATGQKQVYDYGYQTTEVVNWLEFPYALVQVKRTGRVPEGKLKEYKKIESGFKEGIEKLENSSGGIVSNITQGETVYDPGLNVLWSNMKMDVEGVGAVKGLIAIKLTEYGYIQFMGYARESEFSKYTSIYKNMVGSISTKEEDIYKPRLTDNAPTIFGINLGQTAIAAIVGGVIGGIFGLFKLFRRKTPNNGG